MLESIQVFTGYVAVSPHVRSRCPSGQQDIQAKQYCPRGEASMKMSFCVLRVHIECNYSEPFGSTQPVRRSARNCRMYISVSTGPDKA